MGPNGSSAEETAANSSSLQSTVDPLELNKSRIAEEFYGTYDAMTGIRIAITLGGFFAFMVFLVLYKSKSETEKALEDPDFTAAAVAQAEEEEERRLTAAIEAEMFQQLNPLKRSRRSIDTASLSRSWLRATRRYSSVGSYDGIPEPLPPRIIGANPRLPSFDEDSTEDDAFCFHLDVPQRRCSNVTCSSSVSSYLERRDSAFIVAVTSEGSKRRDTYEFCCARGAPLASISSCNSSLETERPPPPATGDDTDDEIEEFSTDSGSDDANASSTLARLSLDSRSSITIVESAPPSDGGGEVFF